MGRWNWDAILFGAFITCVCLALILGQVINIIELLEG